MAGGKTIGLWTGLLLGLLICPPGTAAVSLEEREDQPQEEQGLEDELALLQDLSRAEVESASKHRQPILWSASAITVLTREDIRASGARTLADLLRRVPGFDVYELKSSSPLIGARALSDDSNNLVLLLVDGREALIELTGFPVWAALTFDLDAIDRIEIIRGPGSTLYGANAFAGIVSVTTLPNRPAFGVSVNLESGELGSSRLSAHLRGSQALGPGTLSYALGLGNEHRHSASLSRAPLTVVRVRAHASVRYQVGRTLDLSFHGGLVEGDGVLHMSVDLRGRHVVNHHEMVQVGYSPFEKLRLKAQVYHNRHAGEFNMRTRLTAYGIWVADLPVFQVDADTVDGQLQVDLEPTDGLLLTGGGNLRYTLMGSDRMLPAELGELRGAGYLHAVFTPWEYLELSGGIRFDDNSQTDSAFSPRLVAVLSPWSDQSFRAGYGLAFRKPSFLESRMHFQVEEGDFNPAFPELPRNLATQLGNEALTNERAHSLELGWRGSFLEERLSLSLDLFYNLYSDIVRFEAWMPLRLGMPDVLNGRFGFYNSDDKLHAVGGEFEVRLEPRPTWNAWANLGLRRVWNPDSGERNPEEPALRINFGGGYQPKSGLRFDVSCHFVSSRRVQIMDPFNPFLEFPRFSIGNTWLVQGRLGYSWLAGTVALEAGVLARTPLGSATREYPGMPITPEIRMDTGEEFGGEPLLRLVSAYLRGQI